MNRCLAFVGGFCAVGIGPVLAAADDAAKLPNIVVVLADDLGYGDVRCNASGGKIATPSLDRLASQGMRFTDAHSSSAVCSPTRYSLLTGRYNWRSRLQHGVLGGLSPRLIEPGRMTVGSLLKQHGYRTACVGKWHLGMDWVRRPGKSVNELGIESPAQFRNVDFAQPIANGPNAVGFDEYFGIAGSLDMVPYTFIRNDRVTALPTEDRDFPMMFGRAPRHTRKGPAAPGFEAANVLPELTREAVDYVGRRADDARHGQPFFLYWALTAPHTPIAPGPEWRDKSKLNPYGDFVMQVDRAIGELLDALDRQRVAQDTLVLVTSDNGCSPEADFPALRARGHDPSAGFRGHKADIFEGGHRVPLLVRWPGRVAPGSMSDQVVCLTDVLATCSEVVGARLPDDAGEDSVSLVPALVGRADAPLHEAVVHHSINGSFAIRQGRWKLALCPDSGGWSAPRPGQTEGRGLPPVQLFDLASDARETHNLQQDHPEIVQRLTALLERLVADGRSTPGVALANAVTVHIVK